MYTINNTSLTHFVFSRMSFSTLAECTDFSCSYFVTAFSQSSSHSFNSKRVSSSSLSNRVTRRRTIAASLRAVYSSRRRSRAKLSPLHYSMTSVYFSNSTYNNLVRVPLEVARPMGLHYEDFYDNAA